MHLSKHALALRTNIFVGGATQLSIQILRTLIFDMNDNSFQIDFVLYLNEKGKFIPPPPEDRPILGKVTK